MKRQIEIAKGSRARTSPFARVEEAVEAIRAGRIVIVVDDEDRENEGDLTIAAEKITPEAINFMARHGRGLDLPLDDAGTSGRTRYSADRAQNTSRFDTAFCTPIDAVGGTTTGISAARPRGDDPDGDRSDDAADRSGAAGPRVPAAGAARAACSCAPGRPRRRWTSRASPGCIPPGSSAKS